MDKKPEKLDWKYDNLPTDHVEDHTCSNCGQTYTLRFVVVPTKPFERLTVDPASLGPHPYTCNIDPDTITSQTC